jgi:hypothetical protein
MMASKPKWQIMYNAGQGWRPYSTPIKKKPQAQLRLEAAEEASRRQGDGWEYKLFLVKEETP